MARAAAVVPLPLLPVMRSLARVLLVVLGLLGLSATVGIQTRPLDAQQRVGTCRVLPGTQRAVGRIQGAGRVVYLSSPRLACDGGISIRADSMVIFEATGFNQLFGSVYFEDNERRLRSREARYFDQVGRLEANGNVELTDKESGDVVEGENLLYLRADPRLRRQVEELTVWGGRAHAILHPGAPSSDAPPPAGVQDSVRLGVSAREAMARGEAPLVIEEEEPTGPRTPYDVTADRIFIRGEEVFRATGTVEVTRDSLDASADSLQYQQARERLFLQGNAALTQARFDLRGDEILLILPGDTIRLIESRGEARLEGDDLELDAPLIRVGLLDGRLENLWATPLRPGQVLDDPAGTRVLPDELDSLQLARPRARATDFRMVADSLEVRAPGEVLERLFAAGRARAVSTGRDSLNTPSTPDVIREDWIEGDTVVAFFQRVSNATSPDSADYTIERLEAKVGARSLYRLEPSDTTGAPGSPPPPDPAAGGEEAREQVALMPPDSTTDAGLLLPDSVLNLRDPTDSIPPDPDVPGPVTETGTSPDPRLAVHYVIADEIIIYFLGGEVERMEVKGLDQGLYLDPLGRTTLTAGSS
jgi:lipopolysaccharide export system protein LptA